MFHRLLIILLLLTQPLLVNAAETKQTQSNIIMETTMGTIKIKLFQEKAPFSSDNFRQYVKDGFFDGLLFHRVIPGFVVQGGGFEPGMKKRPTRPGIVNEADNGLKNKRGTLSMARTEDIFSGTSQFFINVADNKSLDQRSKKSSEYGYAVFGKVIEGMDVVDKIINSPTVSTSAYQNVPETDILMLKVYEEK